MTPRDRDRFSAAQAVLANGVRALIRPLRTGDARMLGDFYLSVPAQDYRFYRNRPLTREQAATMAASCRPSASRGAGARAHAPPREPAD